MNALHEVIESALRSAKNTNPPLPLELISQLEFALKALDDWLKTLTPSD